MLRSSLRRRVCLLIAGFLLLSIPGMALAQSSLGIGSAEPAFNNSGLFGGFFDWVNAHQQAFYRSLSSAVKEMREDPAKLWTP